MVFTPEFAVVGPWAASCARPAQLPAAASGRDANCGIKVTCGPLTHRGGIALYPCVEGKSLAQSLGIQPPPPSMKSVFKPALLLLSGAAIFASPVMAAISLEAGSLAVAFYQTNAAGTVVQPNTFVFDLGQSSIFRENTINGVSISTVNGGLASNNIGAQLQTAFGANWANDTVNPVRWMVVGLVASTDPLTSGDPARTTYLSRSRSALSDGATSVGTTIPSISQTNRGNLSTALSGFFTGTNNASQTVGTNADGVQIATSAINSVEDYMPPATLGLFFGQGVDPRQTFAAGLITDSSYAEGALDIYRVLHTATGADLTSGMSAGDAAVGAGQFVGTLLIDGSGNLSVGAIPEPSSTLLLGVLGTLGLVRRKRSAN